MAIDQNELLRLRTRREQRRSTQTGSVERPVSQTVAQTGHKTINRRTVAMDPASLSERIRENREKARATSSYYSAEDNARFGRYDISAGRTELGRLDELAGRARNLSNILNRPASAASSGGVDREGVQRELEGLLADYGGSLSGLEQARNALRNDIAGAVRYRENTALTGVDRALVKPYAVADGNVRDEKYRWINDQAFREQYAAQQKQGAEQVAFASGSGYGAGAGLTANPYEEQALNLMTDDEIAVYNYHYAQGGQEQADRYLAAIQDSLNYRRGIQMYADMEGDTAHELFFGVEAGLDQAKGGLTGLFRDGIAPTSAKQYASGMVREDLADVGGKLPDWLGGGSLGQMGYDAVTTTANMAPSILTSTVIGMVNPALGGYAGLGLMSGSAAGNARQEKLREGYSNGQATAYGLMVGASEAVMEKLLGGISKLGGQGIRGLTDKLTSGAFTGFLNKLDNAFLRVAAEWGEKMVSEGTEEYLQEIIDPILRNMALGESNRLELVTEEALYSGLLGAITGGVMEGPGVIRGQINRTNEAAVKAASEKYGAQAQNYVQNYRQGQDPEIYENNYNLVYEEAKAGVGLDHVLSNEETAKYLTDEQIEQAWQAGKAAGGWATMRGSGESVKVKGVADSAEGGFVLELEDGTRAKRGDILLATHSEELALRGIEGLKVAAADANALLASFREGDVSGDLYAQGVQAAFQAGGKSVPIRELSDGASAAAALSEAQMTTAYELGRKYAEAQVQQERAALTGRATAPGRVHYDGDVSKLSEIQQTGIRALETVAGALGVQIHVFESYVDGEGARVYQDGSGREYSAPNGWYDTRTGDIHIDVNAGQSGRGTMLFAAAHELTHWVRQWSPDKFKALADFLMGQYGEKGVSVEELIERQQAKARATGRPLDYDAAFEELVADSMETMLADGSVVERLAQLKQQDKSLWQKLKEKVTELVGKLKAAYKGLKADSAEGRYVAEMLDAAEELKGLFAEGLEDAGRNFRATGAKNAHTDGDNATSPTDNATVREDRTVDEEYRDIYDPSRDDELEFSVRDNEKTARMGGVKFSFRDSSTGMANDALLPYSEELRGIIERNGGIVVDSEEALRDLVDLAFDNPKMQTTAYFGVLTEATLMDIEKSVPNLPKELDGKLFKPGRQYSVAVTTDSIRHLVDGKKAMTRDDVQDYLDRLADTIIENDSVHFDYYTDSRNNKLRGLHFKKAFTDGTMVAFEIISGKKMSLNLQTMFIEKAAYQKKKSAKPPLMQNASAHTPEARGSQTSNIMLAQDADGVNTKLSARDSEGRELSEEQQRYFAKSVVRENGTLKPVYHGSPSDFNEFSMKYMGLNGTSEGKGFYFTDDRNIAQSYANGTEAQRHQGADGRLYEVYLNIQKPLSNKKVTIPRAAFRKFVVAMSKQADEDGEPLGFLDNYGDVSWEGLNNVVNMVMAAEYDASDNDVNMIHSIINGCGERELVYEVLRKTTGYDGIIVDEATWGGDQTIYVAFHPDQIKNVDNTVPTKSRDIRFSARERDGEYAQAVGRGDMEAAQRMVEDAAERWGAYLNNDEANEIFHQDGKVRTFYHGTDAQDFTTFDNRFMGSTDGDLGWFGKGFYFAFSEDEAEGYGDRVIPAYLRMRNPFDYSQLYRFEGSDASDSEYSQFAWMYNIASQFPDIIKDARVWDKSRRMWVNRNNAREGASVTWEQTVEQMDQIRRELPLSAEGAEMIDRIGAHMENVLGISPVPRQAIEELDFSGAVQRAGYDGILQSMSGDEAVVFTPEQIKSAEPVTYDDSGEVIPLSKRFDAGSKDIRFSERDPGVEKLNKALQKENAAQKVEIEYLRELVGLQSKITGGTKFTRSSVNKLAKELMKEAGAKGNYLELSELLNGVYEYIAGLDEPAVAPDWEDIAERTGEAARWLMDHVETKQDRGEYADEILKDLRGMRISLNQAQTAEAASRYGSYGDFRRAMFGSVTLSRNGTPLDVAWQDLAAQYPGTFDADVRDADMPLKLAEIVAGLRDADLARAEFEANREGLLEDLQQKVYEGYWQVSTLRTVADKWQKKLNDVKTRHGYTMEQLKQARAEAREADELHRQTIRELRREKREAVRSTEAKVAEYYQNARRKATEGRHKTAMRHRIERTVRELEGLLLRGSKERNVKEGMRPFAEEALASANVLFMEDMTDEELVLEGIGTELTPEENRLIDETQHLLSQRKDLLSDAAIAAEAEDIAVGDTRGYDEQMEQLAGLNAKINYRMVRLQDVLTRERARLNKATVGAVLKNLSAAYKALGESDDLYIRGAARQEVWEHLDGLIGAIGGTRVRDMSLSQMEKVYQAFRMVLTTVRDANKLFTEGQKQTLSEAARMAAMEVTANGKNSRLGVKLVEELKKFGFNNLKPVYFFEHLGSNTMRQMYKGLMKGQDTWARDVTDAREYYLRMAEMHGMKDWDMDKTFTFRSASGQELKLNVQQMMSLYAYSRRPQARDHIRKGGVVIDAETEIEEVVEFAKGKFKVKLKGTANDATAYNIDDFTMGEIIGKLTKEQKQFVEQMQNYLSDTMGGKGNEVSMQLYGVKLFNEKAYFPLRSAQQYMARAKEQAEQTAKVKNAGFTKATQIKANNPVVLSPFMDLWSDHVNEMALYHGMTLPLEDLHRVYTFTHTGDGAQASQSVTAAIENAFGSQATEYIDQLMKDLNSHARVDNTTGIINKSMALFKKGSTFLSASVVIQQPSAILRATSMVDSKYFQWATLPGKWALDLGIRRKQHDRLWAELKQYAPVAHIKEMGYFDTSVGRSTRDFIQAQEYTTFQEKMQGLIRDSGYRDEVLSRAPALADELAWCSIWEAVKREQHDKHKDLQVGSEEFLRLCGERFTEVIDRTQVYDSVLSRSANMRSKDTGMKMATAFMAEPTVSANMVADAMLKGKRGDKKFCRRAIGSVISSGILNAMLYSLVAAARDDDEDKEYWEKYLGSVTGEVFEVINPATYLPFARDVWSLLEGYDVERSDMALVADLVNAIRAFGSDSKTGAQKVEQFSSTVLKIFGLPLGNILRDAKALFRVMSDTVDGQGSTAAGIGYAVLEGLPFGKAASNGQQLYEATIAGDTAQIERVAARYKDASGAQSALRKALRENDSRIREAAIAWNEGRLEDYMTIAKGIIGEKHFKQDDVVTAIRAEANALLPDAEDTASEPKHKGLFTAEAFAVAAADGDEDMMAAIREDLIQTAVSNGKTEEAARKNAESNLKSEVKECVLAGLMTEAQAVAALTGYCGMEADGAEAAIMQWKFEAERGYKWSERMDRFAEAAVAGSGDAEAIRQDVISASVAGGKSREEAEKGFQSDFRSALGEIYDAEGVSDKQAVSLLQKYGGKDADGALTTVRYWEFRRDNPGVNVDDSWIDKYYSEIEGSGMSIETYVSYRDQVKGITGTGKKEGRMAVIDSLPISNEQKDALYYSEGWAKSRIHEAPWH